MGEGWLLTSEADGLEVGDPGAGPEVEEVVVRVLGEALALVAVVVHVECLAARVVLAARGAVCDDAAVAVAEEAGGAGADELEAGRLLVGQLAEGTAPLCKHAALSYSGVVDQGSKGYVGVMGGIRVVGRGFVHVMHDYGLFGQ